MNCCETGSEPSREWAVQLLLQLNIGKSSQNGRETAKEEISRSHNMKLIWGT